MDGKYCANDKGCGYKKLYRNETIGWEQSGLESCNKPLLGLMTSDDDYLSSISDESAGAIHVQ
jgi:hypothetical protein